VNALASAGLLLREQRGRQVFFRLDPRCPVLTELRAVVMKTAGLGGVLRHALAPLAQKIRVAFVFGSFARGEQRHSSDVDLMIVGDVSFAPLAGALRGPQARLARAVNPTLYSPAEFRQKLDASNHFLDRVLAGPKLLIIGGEHELAAVATERVVEAAHAEPAGDRRLVRRHRARPRRQ
jgi:predicted nucleotidyltransferase